MTASALETRRAIMPVMRKCFRASRAGIAALTAARINNMRDKAGFRLTNPRKISIPAYHTSVDADFGFMVRYLS